MDKRFAKIGVMVGVIFIVLSLVDNNRLWGIELAIGFGLVVWNLQYLGNH